MTKAKVYNSIINKTRRLGTANGFCVSIRGRVVDPVKIFPTSSWISTQNLVVVSCTVCAHVGSHKTLGDTRAQPPLDGMWLTHQKYASLSLALPCPI